MTVNKYLWVRAGQEVPTPPGMTFQSVVSTRVMPDLYTNQAQDEILLWFAGDDVGGLKVNPDGPEAVGFTDEFVKILKDGLVYDGEHHKQWALEQIAKQLDIDVSDCEYEPGIAP